MRLAPSRSLVFVFSDFRLGDGWEEFSSTLTAATARHDVVAVHLTDPLDEALPTVGLLTVRDPETGATVHLDTSSATGRDAFTRAAADDADRARRLFRRRQVDEIRLRTDAPYNRELLSFFQRRERRLRR